MAFLISGACTIGLGINSFFRETASKAKPVSAICLSIMGACLVALGIMGI